MSPTEDRNEIHELQREWRRSVTASIGDIEAKLDKLLEQQTDMRLNHTRNEVVAALALRIGRLEGDRQKILGAAVLLNAIGGVVLWVIAKFWK